MRSAQQLQAAAVQLHVVKHCKTFESAQSRSCLTEQWIDEGSAWSGSPGRVMG